MDSQSSTIKVMVFAFIVSSLVIFMSLNKRDTLTKGSNSFIRLHIFDITSFLYQFIMVQINLFSTGTLVFDVYRGN